jgi:hypothetical protein
MKKFFLLIFFAVIFQFIEAVTFSDSNLPIVIINTDKNPSTGLPYEIPDNPKILATMKIVFRPDGSRNYLTDISNPLYLNYDGRISIEKRGSTSQDLEKKPYGLTTLKADGLTNNNVSILGLPKENDWILNSLAFDPSLMRDFLSYELSRNIGNYASRGRYCEVMVNGDYKGLYIFMEKLKIDDDRINITKMTNTDNSGINLTGGYITKCDKTTGGDPIAWYLGNAEFLHESPEPLDITTQQNNYIYNQFLALHNAAIAKNNSLINGIPFLIDIPTFVDFFVLNELSSNVDGYQLSTFFHKERTGKLRAGPIWDFNLTYGNDLFDYGLNRSLSNVWQFNNSDNNGSAFWKNLFNNSTFKCYLSKRWNELIAADKPLNYNSIVKIIGKTDSLIAEAIVREQARWGRVSTHAINITNLKTWIQTRQSWLTTQMGSYSSCASVAVPALVISKINYHPVATLTMPGDSLEFIEITNAGSQSVNLSGVYFRELGMTYQFPANASILAGERKILASNARVFELTYGVKPFGQYYRNLSNDAENLVLADGFGNIIDRVEYSDQAPWPVEADGKGMCLELTNLAADNNNPLNWKASDIVMGVDEIAVENQILVYPLPARNNITVYAGGQLISQIEISDKTGRILLVENQVNSNEKVIRINQLTPDVYLLKATLEDGKFIIKKILVN